MIVGALVQKIVSLFIVLIFGAILVRAKLLKSEDSRSFSVLALFIVSPCMIIGAFEVDVTSDVLQGLLLAFGAAVVIHIVVFILFIPLGRIFHFDPVEKMSIIYSNAANLVFPLITAILGKEWVIYSCAFVSVQLFFLWSHGRAILCGEKGLNVRKILTNVNMISVLVGFVVFVTGFRFPTLVEDTISSVGSMMGPLAMLVTGMLFGGMSVKKILSYNRLFLIVFMRLIAVPLLVMCLVKFIPVADMVPNGKIILIITLMATITPSASSVTQMSLYYGKDAEYAGAINVVSTVLCVATMPLMLWLYQL